MEKTRIGSSGVTYIFLFGIAIISWIAFLFSSTSLLQLFQLPLNRLTIIIALLIFILLFSFYSLKKNMIENGKTLLFFWLLFFIAVIATAAISAYFYDYSYDGQSYHGEAILQLANGWNPFYEKIPEANPHAIWINHYAKASWIVEADIYKLTGIFESGKSVNLLLIIANGCIVFYVLSSFTYFRAAIRLLITLFIAFDPVNLNMLFSNMVDGQLASLMSILTALVVLALYKPSSHYLVALYASIFYIANIKFTAIAYLGVYGVCLVILIFLLKKRAVYKKLFINYTVACIVAVAALGFTTYVYNTWRFHHPFYPLAGKEKVSVINPYIPVNFPNQNRFLNFIEASFAKTSYADNYQRPVQLKVPFSISKKEVERYAFSGVMIGGFGVWFSAILLFSLLFFILGLIHEKQKQIKWLFVFLLLSILLSVFINPACWWARYVPQLWLVPFICFIFYWQTGKANQWVGRSFYFVVFINGAIIGGGYCYYNWVVSKTVKAQLTSMKDAGKPWFVNFGNHTAKRIHFIDRNIPYKEVSRGSLTHADTIFRSEVIYQQQQ